MLLMVFPSLLYPILRAFMIANNLLSHSQQITAKPLDNASPFLFSPVASVLFPFIMSIFAPYCFPCRRISFFLLIQSFRRHCSKTAGSDCEAKNTTTFSKSPPQHDRQVPGALSFWLLKSFEQ